MLRFLKDKKAPKACHMLSLRCFCNFFKNASSNHVALLSRNTIFDAISPYMNHEDKNTRMACATVFLNYSVDFIMKEDEEGRIQAMSVLSTAFTKETDV